MAAGMRRAARAAPFTVLPVLVALACLVPLVCVAACAGGGGGAVLAPVASSAAPVVGPPDVADAAAAGAPALASVGPSPAAPGIEPTQPQPPRVTCADRCSGSGTTELVTSITQRAGQTKACYDGALSADRRLRGKMVVLVRITDTGAVCDTRLVATDMPAAVGQCVTRVLGGVDYPPPRGGCVDVSVPLAFEPRDADAGR